MQHPCLPLCCPLSCKFEDKVPELNSEEIKLGGTQFHTCSPCAPFATLRLCW